MAEKKYPDDLSKEEKMMGLIGALSDEVLEVFDDSELAMDWVHLRISQSRWHRFVSWLYFTDFWTKKWFPTKWGRAFEDYYMENTWNRFEDECIDKVFEFMGYTRTNRGN